MTDTNGTKETFEREFETLKKEIIQRSFTNDIGLAIKKLEKLKQLHDTEIEKWLYCRKELVNSLNEKDEEIDELNNKLMGEVEIIKELQSEIEHEKETSCLAIMKVEDDKKKLQAENEKLKKYIHNADIKIKRS